MEEKFDAIVVGAGPAGSACGYTLAKAGLNTLVVERGKFPGAKNMWGGAYYGPFLHELFPNFWEEAPVERYIKRRKFSFLTEDSALSVDFTAKKFKEPPYNGFSVLRAKFDRWLASKAEQAGAIVVSGLQSDDLLWEGSKVSGIKAGGDDLPADVVVACDGVNSILAEKAGLRGDLSPKDMKQGVKEVIQLPREVIEQRFNLSGKEGIAWESLGTFTKSAKREYNALHCSATPQLGCGFSKGRHEPVRRLQKRHSTQLRRLLACDWRKSSDTPLSLKVKQPFVKPSAQKHGPMEFE